MTKNTQRLSESLKEFQDEMQSNYDAIGDLIEQRERIRKAPASQQDISCRIKNIITAMSARYLDAHKTDIRKLTSFKETLLQ